MPGTFFGLTETQITELGMTYGVGGLMLLMVFIVGHLAWESKAGKFGTFALFLGLTFGMVGYIAKYVIKIKLGIL
ncbi:Protein of unknown function DUF2788 [Methylophilaceae bacterium]|jgi:hypothetical protein|nr:DUF2788 domain-containing protein [Candidatus Methylopumilus sp.]